jgi:AraC-like DNA-binding protein
MKRPSRFAVGLTTAIALIGLNVPAVSAATDAGSTRVPKTIKVGKRTLNTDALISKKLRTSSKKLRSAINGGVSISQLAADKGTSASAILSAIIEKATAMLNAEVAAGRMTQTKADRILSTLSAQVQNMLNRALNSPTHGERGSFDLFKEEKIASLLGISESQLEDELDSGLSLLQVATGHSITQETLVAFLASEATAVIDAALAAGKITAETASQMKISMPAKIEAFINRVEPRSKNEKPRYENSGPGELIKKEDVAAAIGITEDQLEKEVQGVSIADVAAAHAVSVSVLTAKLTTVATARIDAGIAAGKITADQGVALKASLPTQINALITQVRGVREAPSTPGTATSYLELKETFFRAAATALGISSDTLERQMKAGLSIGQIALVRNVPQSVVITALTAAGTARVTKALAELKITQLQADNYMASMNSLVTGFISSVFHD